MKLAVSAQGPDLDSALSPVFGRCPYYIVVDTDTMDFQAFLNPAMGAGGGAGIQAAQLVASQGVGAVLTGNLGPNAFQVLQAAGLPVFTIQGGTVREAVEAYKAGQLLAVAEAAGWAWVWAEEWGWGQEWVLVPDLGMGPGVRPCLQPRQVLPLPHGRKTFRHSKLRLEECSSSYRISCGGLMNWGEIRPKHEG